MKTINDFIAELQNLKPELRELPVYTIAPNGLKFEPTVKIQRGNGYDNFIRVNNEYVMEPPREMVITYMD